MRIHDLINSEDRILEGDLFEIDLEHIIIESVVVGFKNGAPIIAVDDIALAYLTTEDIDEGWKQKLATAGIAATMGLGAMGGAHARVSGPEEPGINRLTGKPNITQIAPDEKSNAELPYQDLDKADNIEIKDGKIIITYQNQEYEGVQVSKDAPVPRNAKAIQIPLAKLGIRSIGNAKGYLMPSGKAYIYSLQSTNEAEYQGRKVPLGKPMAGDVKKSKVYVKKPNGNIVKVNFGDKKMKIKKSNPKRRKSFRARHHCENPGPRWKARYWSCRAWE